MSKIERAATKKGFFCHRCQKQVVPEDPERERCPLCNKKLFEALVAKERMRCVEGG